MAFLADLGYLKNNQVTDLQTVADLQRDQVNTAGYNIFRKGTILDGRQNIFDTVNGLTGQGAFELSSLYSEEDRQVESLIGYKLRFTMPSALCSYCLGETRIGETYQMGNVRKMKMD